MSKCHNRGTIIPSAIIAVVAFGFDAGIVVASEPNERSVVNAVDEQAWYDHWHIQLEDTMNATARNLDAFFALIKNCRRISENTMAPFTHKIKNPTTGAPKPGKSQSYSQKIAYHAKHSPRMIDPIKQAADWVPPFHTPDCYSHKPLTKVRQKCKKFLKEFTASLHDLNDQLGAELIELVTSPYGGTVPKTIEGH